MQSISCQTGKACWFVDAYSCDKAAASSDANMAPKMKDVLTTFPFAKLSTYAAVIMIFTHNVLFDRTGACTCKQQTSQWHLYMALPFLILFVLTLWMDKMFQRTCKYPCSCPCRCSQSECKDKCKQCCCSRFCGGLFHHTIKAVFVGLVWVASVLLDGDWYVCCKNDQSEQQAQLACKDKNNITAEEQAIITELKNHSKVSVFLAFYTSCQPVLRPLVIIIIHCGLILTNQPLYHHEMTVRTQQCCNNMTILFFSRLLASLCSLVFLLWLPWCHVLDGGNATVLKNVLKEILRSAAKEKLTEEIKAKMRGGQWEDVAKELIEAKTTPELPEAARNQVKNQHLLAPCWASFVFVIFIWNFSSVIAPTLWSRLKYLNKYLMDCHEIFNRHSCFFVFIQFYWKSRQQLHLVHILLFSRGWIWKKLWSSDFSCSTIIRSKFSASNTLVYDQIPTATPISLRCTLFNAD